MATAAESSAAPDVGARDLQKWGEHPPRRWRESPMWSVVRRRTHLSGEELRIVRIYVIGFSPSRNSFLAIEFTYGNLQLDFTVSRMEPEKELFVEDVFDSIAGAQGLLERMMAIDLLCGGSNGERQDSGGHRFVHESP